MTIHIGQEQSGEATPSSARAFHPYLLAAMMFTGLMGSFMSMLEWGVGRIGLLSAGGFSFLGLADGFRLVFNRLFTISEQQQAYRYVMFTIISPAGEWDRNIAAALLVIAGLLAVFSIALVFSRLKILVVLAVILVVWGQVYFGVFPSAIWNIMLFASFALRLLHRHNSRGIITVIAATTLVAIGVWAICPGANPALSQFSESIRDRFDIRISQITGAPTHTQDAGHGTDPDNRDLNVVDVQEDGLHESPLHDYYVLYDERARGAEIGALSPAPSLLPILLVTIAVLVIIAVARYLPRHLKVVRRRRMLDAEDCPLNDMFTHMLEWLFAYGLKQKNIVFSGYATQLSELVSLQYSEEYISVTALWQKAVYSDHAPDDAERKLMRDFMYKTMDVVWKNSSMMSRMRIKFQYLL